MTALNVVSPAGLFCGLFSGNFDILFSISKLAGAGFRGSTVSEQKTVYIGIGSNQGDRADNFRRALELLNAASGIAVRRLSRAVVTEPLAGREGGDYLNAVAEIETNLRPCELLDCLKRIELSLGRVLTSRRWLSRPMDLDILFFGSEIIDTALLSVPHGQLHLRSFVLAGLCELVPDFVHPLFGETVSVLAKRLSGQNFYIDLSMPRLICIAGVIGAGKTTLASALAERFGCEVLREAYSKNPYLSRVYAGEKALALDSQLFFLRSRVAQLASENLQPGKIAVSDYVIDKERIYARAWLDGEQLQRYSEINTRLCKSVIVPSVVIYLNLSPELCLERIHSRNRPYEQEIDLDFLRALNVAYEELFANWRQSPLFRLDSSRYDFREAFHVDRLVRKLRFYLAPVR